MNQHAVASYKEYKQSGLDWLGDIPTHWSLKKSKFLWREKEERSKSGEEQLLSVSQYLGIVPKEDDSRSESLEDYKVCKTDDLVINIMLAWMSGLGVTPYDGIVSPAYCVYRQLENHNPKYLDYLYRTPIYLAEFARRSLGIVPSRWRMYTEDFGQVLTLLPPRVEQDRIANFLDQKTTEIDEAIAKKRRLIELLKEQKTILINQAVTKGLKPNVPMKDSGEDWIPTIPESWSITRLKFVSKFIVDCLHATPKYSANGEYPAIRTADIIPGKVLIDKALKVTNETYVKWIERAKPQENDILYSREGGRFGIAAIVPSGIDLCISQRMTHFRIKSEFNPKYIMWQLNCMHVFLQASIYISGAASPHVNMSTISNFILCLPGRKEQDAIVNFIDSSFAKIDNVLLKIEDEINFLNEFKHTLVTDAVTGKIKL